MALKLAGAALIALPLSALAATPDCAPPRPHPPMTIAQLRRQGGDATPLAARAVNRLYDEDLCLRRQAWKTRHDGGPVEAMAKRALHTCASAFEAYEAVQAEAAPNKTARDAQRREDVGNSAGIALTYVRQYRDCER